MKHPCDFAHTSKQGRKEEADEVFFFLSFLLEKERARRV